MAKKTKRIVHDPTLRTRSGTPKRRPAKKSTALVRRKREPTPPVRWDLLLKQKSKPEQVMELLERGRELPAPRTVTDGFMLDTIGLVTLKTTPEQEKILSRDPDVKDVAVLPDGAPYLPHPVYTRWLNEAFGRGGWQLVPVSKPALIEHTVNVKYLLYVDGKPVALADGKQEYHPTNRNQDYGDVLEATRSNALRRASKHLGIALHLWDRKWCAAWRQAHCVQVTVMGRKREDDGTWRDQEMKQWRRRDDEPLKGEREARSAKEPTEPPKEEHALLDEFISKPKRERFWRIARRVGRDELAIKAWLRQQYGIEDTRAIKNRDYDKIVKILEGPGDLPVAHPSAGQREPGQEG